MAASQPAVLVILGSYYTPASFAPFAKTLEGAGYHVVCPALPTNDDPTRPPTASLYDDANIIKQASLDLIRQKYRILVVAHSYGGCVANSALTSDLFSTGNTEPGIVHLTYLAAFTPLPGESMLGVLGIFGWQSSFDVSRSPEGLATLKNPFEGLWNDSKRSDVEHLAPQLVTFNFSGGCESTVTLAPWTNVVTTYIVCVQDKALFADMQRGLVKRLREHGDSPGGLEMVELDSAHSPFQTKPTALLELLQRIWTKVGVSCASV